MGRYIAILFLCFVGLITQAQIIDTIRFSETDLTIETFDGYDRILLQGCHSSEMYGWRELPVMTIKYVIPSDKKISCFTVLDSLVYRVPGNYTVYPVQKTEPAIFYINDSIYGTTTPYVSNTIEYVEEYYEN